MAIGAPRLSLKKCSVIMRFYFPDNRVADLTNKAESIMDLLVDFGILADDRWQYAHTVIIKGAMSREDPRVDITLKY